MSWSSVAPDEGGGGGQAPSARTKHSATAVGEHVYLLAGRNGNLPQKDFWRYNLVTGKWQQLKPSGDKLPCLQEHTAVVHRDSIYVFGGEVSFSAGTETPLWVYDIKGNSWRKVRTKKGVAIPKGRRGHTALVHNGSMLIYGGYQDLKGSCGELWAFHFDTESWHLLSASPNKNSDQYPAPRHKHCAVLHGDCMWIYGGMTDLQERSDLWKFDLSSRTWTHIKTKINPGPLHSHAACKMPSSMIIFGGERNGQTCNDLWKFNFDIESWEKITISGTKPQPRAESVALTVSELLLKGSSSGLEAKFLRTRARTCNSADRGQRHSSYLPNNKVAPCENTYIFKPSHLNYNDGSNLAEQYSENIRTSRSSFLQEISKLSNINISRMSNKCSYTVLTRGKTTDSTESLLRQHASPAVENEVLIETEFSTPSRGTMVKSKSAHAIKNKKYSDSSPEEAGTTTTKKRVEFGNSTIKKIPREPISVPNFSMLTLPTPVLTPVEAAKLVYLDTDDENDLGVTSEKPKILEEDSQKEDHREEEEGFNPLKRGDSYTSHLGYADNPLYQQMITSLEEKSAENVSSTSDYASIETVNRLSSASNYSVKTGTPQEENSKNKERDKDGPFGFCNPNYMGPDLKSILVEDKKTVVKMLSTEEKSVEFKSDEEDILELQSFNGSINQNSTVVYRQSSRTKRPPKSLSLDKPHCRHDVAKCRAHSASRIEKNKRTVKPNIEVDLKKIDPHVPLYVYVIGGKEQGQVTVFQRPISIWRLKLF